MEYEYLKETLFDLFRRFSDYDLIINDLKDLHNIGELDDKEYNAILENYDKWAIEFEESEE